MPRRLEQQDEPLAEQGAVLGHGYAHGNLAVISAGAGELRAAAQGRGLVEHRSALVGVDPGQGEDQVVVLHAHADADLGRRGSAAARHAATAK